MDFPEMKYHAGGIVPSEYAWRTISDDEDTSDNPTVIMPLPEPPPSIEERWFLPF